MLNFSKKTKTIVLIGTGGVGKTTTAASLGFGKAHEGFKVLVITIDPSKRLAQAMNFKPNGQIQKISTTEKKGSLYASTINHQKVFDDFISHAFKKTDSNKNLKDDILNLSKNKLFQQLTTRLSQSQDFTTLFYLFSQVQSKDYDYVILDTPPAQHTWSFLKAPEKITALFSDDVGSWFKLFDNSSGSLVQKFLKQSSLKIINILQTLTGSEFISELRSFFNSIYAWQKPLNQVVINCQKLLISDETEFILVTNFDQNKFKTAAELSRAIYNEGYNLTHLIINMVPDWLDEKQNYQNDIVESFRQSYQQTLKKMTVSVTNQHDHLNVYKSLNLSQNLTQAEMLKIYNQIQRLD